MTNQFRELAQHPLAEHIQLVIIEATSDYWRQFYFLLGDAGLTGGRSMPAMPGIFPRKTDVSDAAWLEHSILTAVWHMLSTGTPGRTAPPNANRPAPGTG